jgi:hypothetical protein
MKVEKQQSLGDYQILDKVVIREAVLNSLYKNTINAAKNQIEGVLFGHEGENSLVVDNAIPLSPSSTHDDISNFVSLILTNLIKASLP